MHADFWNTIRKLYALGILIYFAAAGVLALSISDFSSGLSFMGRHAVYALAWPTAAVVEINSCGGNGAVRNHRRGNDGDGIR